MSALFGKVLIANRGVAAMRLSRTLRRLGIPYVAVFSEADKEMPYVTEADSAYCLGGNSARESYLNAGGLLKVMEVSGADALHPGYGFLAENAEFADRISAAGYTFIGPDPAHIALMGDKVRARAQMGELGIPLLPASGPLTATEDADVLQAARQVGFPLLVKPVAGGGGIGMRRVPAGGDVLAQVRAARRVATRAFGDDRLYLERHLERPRHIEFQIAGDGARVAGIFERDCSLQRRHQKVIEESPAPFIAPDACRRTEDRLGEALSQLRYRSLGTVEMLMDGAGDFYFLEMNTRLQVEHRVTEAVTGLDLVEMQLRLAAGAELSAILDETGPIRSGHAIEARIYAEDPERLLPSVGTVDTLALPEGPDVTVDTWLWRGAAVTPFYDPMLAVVVVHAPDRGRAVGRLKEVLSQTVIGGVKTNIPFLLRLLDAPEVEAGRYHTHFAEALVSQ